MSVVIATYTSNSTMTQLTNDGVSATGIIAIVALTSISKIESLVKKIFGLNSSIADDIMKRPHGLGASLMALQLGKRVFDNGKKVAGGIGDAISAGRDKKKAKLRYARRQNLLDGKNDPSSNTAGGGTDQNGEGLPVGGGSSQNSNPQTLSQAERDYLDKAKEAKKNGDMNAYHENMNRAAAARRAGMEMYSNQNLGSGSNNSNSSGKSNSKSYAEKMLDLQEKYEDELAAAKKRRRQGIKNIASGALETGGAIAGFGIGGAVGLAYTLGTGDTPLHAVKSAVSGMGIGDSVGETVTNMGSSIINAGKYVSGARDLNNKYDAALSEAEKNLNIERKNRSTKNARFKVIQAERKRITDEYKNMDAGSI